MELPETLKNLYKHWPQHTAPRGVERRTADVFSDSALYDKMRWFIQERMHIWEQKTLGAQPPLTQDSILATYRFCNMFRELDKQTIAFHTLLAPLQHDLPLWLLNMFYCRMVARPETIETTGLLSLDNTRANEVVLKRLLSLPSPKYGTPYVFPITVIQQGSTPTRELFIARHLPSAMRPVANEIRTWRALPVFDGVPRVTKAFGYSLNFLWTEVLIDMAYQFPEYIDLFARFPVGPGAAPTLARIHAATEPSCLVVELSRMRIPSGLTYNGTPVQFSAENWEGICCEFRKYTNLAQGRGRRRLYTKQTPRQNTGEALF